MNKFLRTSVLPCCMAAACLTLVATHVSANAPDLARKVSGTITQVDTRRVAVATSWGHMSVQSDALRNAKIGDEVTMWVNESNVVIDAYPKGSARPAHHQVSGTLTDASPEKNAITIRTLDGEQEFMVQKNRPKFTMFKEGTPLTLQLNDKGQVIDVHRQVGLQLGLAPMPEPGFRIKLEGVVARIKSGQVFVKTPGAEYSLNAKSVLQDVQVGDQLTIWVSDNNVAVDHHAKGKAGAHRYIMGQLTSASGDLREITLMTLHGTQSFSVQHGESTLSGMKEGTSVRVELNEAGHVIEIRKVG
jgi:hypothetical protein